MMLRCKFDLEITIGTDWGRAGVESLPGVYRCTGETGAERWLNCWRGGAWRGGICYCQGFGWRWALGNLGTRQT